jgi:hypothetical protein
LLPTLCSSGQSVGYPEETDFEEVGGLAQIPLQKHFRDAVNDHIGLEPDAPS